MKLHLAFNSGNHEADIGLDQAKAEQSSDESFQDARWFEQSLADEQSYNVASSMLLRGDA